MNPGINSFSKTDFCLLVKIIAEITITRPNATDRTNRGYFPKENDISTDHARLAALHKRNNEKTHAGFKDLDIPNKFLEFKKIKRTPKIYEIVAIERGRKTDIPGIV